MDNEITVKKPETVASKQPTRIYRPVVDIHEQDGAITLMAELPGVQAGDLNVEVTARQLSIQGIISREAPDGFDAAYNELPVGEYRRTFKLSSAIDLEGIKAELKNGLLILSLPKVNKALPRKVEIAVA